MAVRSVLKNTQIQIEMIALDASGKRVTGYPTTPANMWQIVDNLGASWPVSASSVSDGVITLTTTTPNATGNRSFDIRRAGVSQTLLGSNVVQLSDGYSGKFDLTNAILAWDMSVTGTSQTTIYDQSGNGYHSTPYNQAAFTDPIFTAASQYKISTVGGLVTLGRSLYSDGVSGTTQSVDGIQVENGSSILLNPGFLTATDMNSTNVKTISIALWRKRGGDNYSTIADVKMLNIRQSIGGKRFDIKLDYYAFTGLGGAKYLYFRHDNIVEYSLTCNVAPNWWWFDANQIIIIQIVITPTGPTTANYVLYANKTQVSTGTLTVGATSSTGTAVYGPFYDVTIDSTDGWACLDFAIYNQALDVNRINANATAWGY